MDKSEPMDKEPPRQPMDKSDPKDKEPPRRLDDWVSEFPWGIIAFGIIFLLGLLDVLFKWKIGGSHLSKCLRRAYGVVQGWRPGAGASRRVIRPIIAHLTIATEVLGSRS